MNPNAHGDGFPVDARKRRTISKLETPAAHEATESSMMRVYMDIFSREDLQPGSWIVDQVERDKCQL